MLKIPVFVTGGIGGVHREAETTFDISSDLAELSRAKNTVVISCSWSQIYFGHRQNVRSFRNARRNNGRVQNRRISGFFHSRFGIQTMATGKAQRQRRQDLIHARNNMRLNSRILLLFPFRKFEKATGAEIERHTTKALREAEEKERYLVGRSRFVLTQALILSYQKGKV